MHAVSLCVQSIDSMRASLISRLKCFPRRRYLFLYDAHYNYLSLLLTDLLSEQRRIVRVLSRSFHLRFSSKSSVANFKVAVPSRALCLLSLIMAYRRSRASLMRKCVQ